MYCGYFTFRTRAVGKTLNAGRWAHLKKNYGKKVDFRIPNFPLAGFTTKINPD